MCGDTAQYPDSSTLLLDGTSNFGRGDSSGLKAEPQTTLANRQEKANRGEF